MSTIDRRRRINLPHLLIGRPLETKALPHQRVSKKVGLAVFASDALSSTAYATEESALVTFVVMLIFAVTKFTSGAWFVVLLIPVLVIGFFRIHDHYKAVASALSLKRNGHVVAERKVQTLILVDDVHNETLRMVSFAKSLGHPWRAIHVAVNPEKVERIQQRWSDYVHEGELEIIASPYRHLAAPIRDYVEQLIKENPNTFVHIIMGHLVMDTFWEQALHQNTAFIFNVALTGLPQVVVSAVPYQVHSEGGQYRAQERSLTVQPEPQTEAPVIEPALSGCDGL